jgi:two-component system, cell cycle sensor histidine kinase and response regulator CckA
VLHRFSQVIHAVGLANLLGSPAMTGLHDKRSEIIWAGGPSRGGVILAATLTLAAALILGLVAMWSARAIGPLVLAFLSLLAVIGVFFLFGTAAGLIRLHTEDEHGNLNERAAEGLDLGFLVTDAAGHTLQANRAFRKIVGEHSSGEPRSLEEAFSTEPQAAECLFRLLRAIERGEPRQEEFRFRGQDGRSRTSRWLRVTVRPMPAALGSSESQPTILWQIADITQEHARVAETLRALETRLAHFDALPFGLMELAADGRVSEINRTLAGWLAREVPIDPEHGVHLSEILAPGAEAALRLALAAAEGQWARIETDLMRAAGVLVPVEVVAIPPADPALGGAIPLFILPRRARQDIGGGARHNDQLARFLNSAPFGMATIAADGRVLNANATFAHLFRDGAAREITTTGDIVGRVTDVDARAALQRAIDQALKGRAGDEPVEVTLGQDGAITRRLFLNPVSGVGEATAVVYVIDATEQKALELKYAQSTKMEAVGKLAGGIAHDFNNVLTAIIGFSDLLLQTHRPTDAAYKDIMNIKQNANRAAGMVRQLLAFSRRQTLQPEVLELGDVISDTAAALLRKLIGETVDLKIFSGRDLWLVKADRTQLDQVVINLAVNAKDAMPDGGRLTIEMRNVGEADTRAFRGMGMPAGEFVEIAVTDTGHGMTPEIMAKIFEPFFSTKDVGKGTGLGLSTVYGIVKQTGGFVFPESTPGKGTTFRVYLPRHVPTQADADAAAAQRAPKKERQRDLTGSGRVLLVEDEDAVRSFAIRALKRQGYEVVEATSGLEGVERFEEQGGRIDIVVSDVVMPEMDGPSMLKELRKRNPDIKVIFMSGYPDDAFKRNLDPNEQFAFLAKPFTLPQLATKVKEELER